MVLNLSAEDFLLLLLNSNGKEKIMGKLCFQKEMFLVANEVCPDLDLKLDFKAQTHGPFSKNLANILYWLDENSFINIEKSADTCRYSITEKGVEKVSKLDICDEISKKISNLKSNSNKLGYNGLLRYVYFNYPEYTKKLIFKSQ